MVIVVITPVLFSIRKPATISGKQERRLGKIQDAFVLMKMNFKHIKEFCQEKFSILFPFKVHCVKLP